MKKYKNKKLMSIIALSLIILITYVGCKKNDDSITNPPQQTKSCDFSMLTASSMETYDFSSDFPTTFLNSPSWNSINADITLVNEQGQLNANAGNTSNALEAWKLFNMQMPYNKSWEISVDVTIPLFWNSNGGTNAQVGTGIFVGQPIDNGVSCKVYECNMAAINGQVRFVQAQLIANRCGDDPIDVQFTKLNQSLKSATLKITFCTTNKTLSLFIDNAIVGKGQAIDGSGLDNWNLKENSVMDVGIMGFAENTVITSNQPTLDNFKYSIY